MTRSVPYPNRTKLPPPLGVYERVFWRLLYFFIWVMAYLGPWVALAGILSLFIDIPGELYMNGERVRSADENVGFILSAAAMSVVGRALLPRLPNGNRRTNNPDLPPSDGSDQK